MNKTNNAPVASPDRGHSITIVGAHSNRRGAAQNAEEHRGTAEELLFGFDFVVAPWSNGKLPDSALLGPGVPYPGLPVCRKPELGIAYCVWKPKLLRRCPLPELRPLAEAKSGVTPQSRAKALQAGPAEVVRMGSTLVRESTYITKTEG